MPGPALAHNISEYTPAQAEEYARITITQNYVLYATSAVLVYELLVTFDEEVERVWSLKWRLPKLLFMVNRYLTRGLLILQYIAGGYPGTSESVLVRFLPPLLPSSQNFRSCHIYGYWQAIPPRMAILAAQAIMIIRLSAIYHNNKTMLYLLALLYTLEIVAVITCMTLAIVSTQGSSQPPPLSCGLDARSPLLRQYASGTWIAPVCFELIILIVTMVKVFPPPPAKCRVWKGYFLKGFSIATPERNPTLDMLARDSIIYFAFIFSFTLTNAIIYELDFAAYYRSILLGPTSAISCIAVSRMIINIRSLPAPNLDTPYPSVNMIASGVMFAENSELDPESGVPEVRRSSSSRRGRVTGKERESVDDDEYEMMSPASLKMLDEV